MKVIKKIFNYLFNKSCLGIILAISLILFSTVCLPALANYHPTSKYETYKTRLYSPAVHLERSDHIFGRGRSIKIVSGDYEFSYGSYKSAKNEEYLAHERLQLEEYLDIIYIIRDDMYIIVEIHGVDYTYYTIEDYNSRQNENLVGLVVLYVILQIMLIGIYVWTLFPDKHPETRLRKKHPVEKHVYYDEENEFSPYKQKLIEEEREEE